MKTTLSFERLLRVLPPVLTVLLVVVCLVVGSRISWSNLLTYTPPNLLPAAVGILALYAVKSLSVVFPLSVLYIACALWFGRWGGLMMCYLGLTVSCTLPYLIVATSAPGWWSISSGNIPGWTSSIRPAAPTR